MTFKIGSMPSYMLISECCKELQLKSQENSKANRTIGHLLGLYTKHTNDTFYTKNGDNNSYLTKSNTWQVISKYYSLDLNFLLNVNPDSDIISSYCLSSIQGD